MREIGFDMHRHTQLSGRDDFCDSLHRRLVAPLVTNPHNEPRFIRCRHHPFDTVLCEGQGFLAEDLLAVPYGRQHLFLVLRVRSAEDHRVDLRVLEDLVVVVRKGDSLLCRKISMSIGPARGQPHDLDLIAVLHRVDHMATPPAESYHRRSDHYQPPFLLTRAGLNEFVNGVSNRPIIVASGEGPDVRAKQLGSGPASRIRNLKAIFGRSEKYRRDNGVVNIRGANFLNSVGNEVTGGHMSEGWDEVGVARSEVALFFVHAYTYSLSAEIKSELHWLTIV